MKTPLLPTTLLAAALALAGCHRTSQADKDAALDVVRRNAQATQDEKIDEMMATMHPQSPAFAETRRIMEDMAQRFDLKCVVSGLDVLTATNEEMRVRFVQTLEKVKGDEPFPKRKITGIHVLKKDGGVWKIFGTEVLRVEEFAEPEEPVAAPEPPAAEPKAP